MKYAIRKNPRDIDGSLIRSAEPWWSGRTFVADAGCAKLFDDRESAEAELPATEGHSYVPVEVVEFPSE